jgi:D-ornithine---citrate ligase
VTGAPAAAVVDRVAAARAALAAAAPELVPGFDAALPAATGVVGRRLLGAAYREGLVRPAWRGDRVLLAGRAYPARRHGFDRLEVAGPVETAPERLAAALGITGAGLAEELCDARAALAVALARRAVQDPPLRERAARCGAPDLYALAAPLPADEQMVLYERLSTEGHNLHPCGRTRLGWSVADLLAHDLEGPGTRVEFVAVRSAAHLGDDVGALLREAYPDAVPPPPAGYLLQPVHAWQARAVLPHRYRALFRAGVLRPVPGAALPATPTAALRTLLLEPDRHGARRYLKLSLDIQVTSTRRGISVAATRNGPVISALLHRLDLLGPDALLLPEVAGSAGLTAGGHGRDLAAIVRAPLAGRLEPGEVAVPGAALPAISPLTGRSVLAELLARYPGTAAQFLTGYARLLLPPVLRLAAVGVGLEAHLQNCIPTFRDGVPHRMVFRDLAGPRLHLPRLRERAGWDGELWPGSVTGTGDLAVMRAKLAYTAVQAHLGEVVVLLLAAAPGLDERRAWRRVREVLDEALRAGDADPADHAFLTAPRVPHKALVRMRLSGEGDVYVPVPNPLHEP